MNVESKIKFRAYLFIVAGFIVLILLIGIIYALLAALLVFLFWRAYKWLKLMHWWNSESLFTRQMIEYITNRLDEGNASRNLWVRGLAIPETAEYGRNYRVELMARPMIIEKESANLVEGWTEWGATRLEEHVIPLSPEDLTSNVGFEDRPIPLGQLMVARVAFEVLVAEHALELLNVPSPRAAVSRGSCQRNSTGSIKAAQKERLGNNSSMRRMPRSMPVQSNFLPLN